MLKIGSSMKKFEVKKFNGKENFNLLQKRMKALLVQHSLHKTYGGSHQNLQVRPIRKGEDGSKGDKHDPTMSRILGDVQHDG